MTQPTRGFAPIIILVVIFLALAGTVGYVAMQNKGFTETNLSPILQPNKITILSPKTGDVLHRGVKTTVQWQIPQTFLDSFPADFDLYVFLYVDKKGDATTRYASAIGDGLPAKDGQVVWNVNNTVWADNGTGTIPVPAGEYKIRAQFQAVPHDHKRLCAIQENKDCSPSAADAAIIARSAGVEGETGWFTITDSAGTLSVPGMSKYTDTDFGFSFWYPNTFTVIDVTSRGLQFSKSDQQIVKRLAVRSSEREIWIDEVNSPSRSFEVSPGACGYCGALTYYFDTALHTWMKVYPDGPNGAPDATPEQIAQYKQPKPANVSINTMGGLHMFSTEQKESAVITPLSAQHFVIVRDNTYTQNCGSACASSVKGGAQYLARTIIATDPSVATPVSEAEQIKTIQAEKDAYVTQVKEESNALSASPISGQAPLTVTFTPVASAGSESIDFGDGHGTLETCGLNKYGEGDCDIGNTRPTHTYTSPGTYVAKLWRQLPSIVIGKVTIIVSP